MDRETIGALGDRDWLARAVEFTNTRIRPIAKSLGMDLETLAIKYVLTYPISAVMVTATSIDDFAQSWWSSSHSVIITTAFIFISS